MLQELAKTLITACQWKQAETIVQHIQADYMQTGLIRILSLSLEKHQQYDHLFALVQRQWQAIETRDEAFKLLPLAFGLIKCKPELGSALYRENQRVQEILQEKWRTPG